CPKCHEPQYHDWRKTRGKKKITRCMLTMMAIGQTIQAMKQHPDMAEKLLYRARATKELF
ncbi:hypothetical protein CONPUDRAFT_59041, partial [Coniophora puteana RWD-64-598 SS2]